MSFSLLPLLLNDFRNASVVAIPKRFRYHRDRRPINKQRKLIMQVVMPRFGLKKEKYIPPYLMNKKGKIDNEAKGPKLYGLDVVLHKELQEIINNNSMFCICLRTYMPSDDMYYKVQYELRQHNMDMQRYPYRLMRFTLQGTPYARLLQLAAGQTAIIFGEPNIKEMLPIIKRNMYLLLLGGLVDGKYMSLSELQDYATLGTLDTSRGQLCGLLTSLVSSTHHLLQRPSAALSSSLTQYEKDLSEQSQT